MSNRISPWFHGNVRIGYQCPTAILWNTHLSSNDKLIFMMLYSSFTNHRMLINTKSIAQHLSLPIDSVYNAINKLARKQWISVEISGNKQTLTDVNGRKCIIDALKLDHKVEAQK